MAATKGTRAPALPASASITSSGCLALIRFPASPSRVFWGRPAEGVTGLPQQLRLCRQGPAVLGARGEARVCKNKADATHGGARDFGDPAPAGRAASADYPSLSLTRAKAGGHVDGDTSLSLLPSSFPRFGQGILEGTQSRPILAEQAPQGTHSTLGYLETSSACGLVAPLPNHRARGHVP